MRVAVGNGEEWNEGSDADEQKQRQQQRLTWVNWQVRSDHC